MTKNLLWKSPKTWMMDKTLERVTRWLKKIKYKNHDFTISDSGDKKTYVLTIRNVVTDSGDPARQIPQLGVSRMEVWKIILLTETKFVAHVFDLILDMEKHEAREWFMCDGMKIFYPKH